MMLKKIMVLLMIGAAVHASAPVKEFNFTINYDAPHVNISKIMLTPNITSDGYKPICPPLVIDGPLKKTMTIKGQCEGYPQNNSSCNCFKDARLVIMGTRFPGIIQGAMPLSDRKILPSLITRGNATLVARLSIKDMGNSLVLNITDERIEFKPEEYRDLLNAYKVSVTLDDIRLMNIDPAEQKRSWEQYPNSPVDTIFGGGGNIYYTGQKQVGLSEQEELERVNMLKELFIPEAQSVTFKNSTPNPIQVSLFCPKMIADINFDTRILDMNPPYTSYLINTAPAPITINANQTQKVSMGKYCSLMRVSSKDYAQTYFDKISVKGDTRAISVALSELPTSWAVLSQDDKAVYEFKSVGNNNKFVLQKNDGTNAPSPIVMPKYIKVKNNTQDPVALITYCQNKNTNDSAEVVDNAINSQESKIFVVQPTCGIWAIVTKKPTYSMWKTMKSYGGDRTKGIQPDNTSEFNYDNINYDSYIIGDDYNLKSN